MEFVEAGDARVPINTLALLILVATRRTRGGTGGTGCSNPTKMERFAIQRTVLHWPVGRAWLMTRGPVHGGAADYGFLASDRFRSCALVGGEMDRVTQRLHIDRVVLLVNAVTGGPYEEADLTEEWCEDQMAAGLTLEEAEAEAMKWIREENSPGVIRQKLLSDPQQRSTVRKEVRTHLRYLRGA